MRSYLKINIWLFSLLFLIAIGYVFYLYLFSSPPPNTIHTPDKCSTEKMITKSKEANEFFDAYFEEETARYPEWQTYLGINKNDDKWTPLTEEFQLETKENAEKALVFFNKNIMACHCLDEQTQLSSQLFKLKLETTIQDYEYRHFDYPVKQLRGVHAHLPTFLINAHDIESYIDALNYIKRVTAAEQKLEQLIEQLQIRAEKNVILPLFLFKDVLASIKHIKNIQPVQSYSIHKDFVKKINKITLSPTQKKHLIKQLEEALLSPWKNGYQKLYDYLILLEKKASNQEGIWKLEQGANYYHFLLNKQTTTHLTANEIFDLGKEEVFRIHQEIDEIIKKLNFEGDRAAFFDFMRNNPNFYYPNNRAGREQYIKASKKVIHNIQVRIEDLFITKPKAKLVIKNIGNLLNKTASKAFYRMAAPDGSRPGTYYINTYDMTHLPTYEIEVMAYHQTIPGHHSQFTIAQELHDLPKFRRLENDYMAYKQGWGCYSEYLPKELGFYQDPYSDFGRLSLELWRACRLVVDVGIHDRQWTRKEALAYYKKNTPNIDQDCQKMVNRHIVIPAEATTYQIGLIIILELRQKAKEALGENFNLRKFHEAVLTHGALPLDILQNVVEDFIQKELNEQHQKVISKDSLNR